MLCALRCDSIIFSFFSKLGTEVHRNMFSVLRYDFNDYSVISQGVCERQASQKGSLSTDLPVTGTTSVLLETSETSHGLSTQNYFSIYRKLNQLCLPLDIELQFFQ